MEDEEIDVYNFLRMVNSSKLEDAGTSCLGAEIEDLDQDEYMDFDPSPVRESGAAKPTFEDGIDLSKEVNIYPKSCGNMCTENIRLIRENKMV